MSGTKLSLLDPCEVHLNSDHSGAVRDWNLGERNWQEWWLRWSDLRAPWAKVLQNLGLPDVFRGEKLKGALFRLPLRTVETELSENIYNPMLVSE